MISSAIILPILPAPALVPPGIPGTVGWVLLGPPEMSRNFQVREKLAHLLHRTIVFRLWAAAGPSELDLLMLPSSAGRLQMDEKLWLALNCAGSQMSLCASRDRTDPTLLESGCSLSKWSIWCYLLSRAATDWPCQTCPTLCPNRLFPKHVCSLLCLKNLPVHIPFNLNIGINPRYLVTANKAPVGNCRSLNVEGKVRSGQLGAATAMWFHTCTALGRLSGRRLIYSKQRKAHTERAGKASALLIQNG